MAALANRCLLDNAAVSPVNNVANAITSVVVVNPGAGISVHPIGYRQTNLLAALQEMSDASYHAWARGAAPTPCEFRLVRTGNATWELQIGLFAADRRVNQTAEPVIFDYERGNVSRATLKNDHSKAATVGHGNGENEADLVTVVDALRVTYSPFNAVERSYSARNTVTVAENETCGEAFFRDNGDSTTAEYQVLERAGVRFGVDWNVGDWVSTRFDGAVYESVQIRGVRLTYSNSGAPTITPSFEYLDGRNSRGRSAFEQLVKRLNDVGRGVHEGFTGY